MLKKNFRWNDERNGKPKETAPGGSTGGTNKMIDHQRKNKGSTLAMNLPVW
jgi:hypothetical protein